MNEVFDVAIIGAGPAGMQAANTAAANGCSVILIEGYAQAGGQYFMRPLGGQNVPPLGNFPILLNTLVWGIFREDDPEWWVALFGLNQPKGIRARNLILANGAFDTPIAFPGWTLPGVMTCGAALTLLKAQRLAPGTRVLVTGTGPLLLSVAAHLIEAGVEVKAICEANRLLPRGVSHAFTALGQQQRMKEGAGYLKTILQAGTPYKTGWSILEARGAEQVEEASISKVDSNGRPSGSPQKLTVDLVVSGYGLTPNTGLARMIGCDLEYRADRGGWIPVRSGEMESSIAGVYVVGDGAGIGGAENSQLEGQVAGVAASVRAGKLSAESAAIQIRQINPKLKNQQKFGAMVGDLFSPQAGLISLAKDDTLLCRCEEVTLGEVKQAVLNGAKNLGEVKRLTRCGMGNCQGRMCERSVSAAIVEALASELTDENVGYYKVRPPLHPIPQSFLAE